MTAAIQPSGTLSCLQEILFKPFAEGAERVNRAIEGVNLHHILHSKMSLLERSWSLLVGVCLMIPLINSILWICMKTFGNPEVLTEPLAPESPIIPVVDSPPMAPEAPPIIPAQDIFKDRPTEVRRIIYKGTANDIDFENSYRFETYEDRYQVVSHDGPIRSETTFDLNWNQQTHHIKMGEATNVFVKKEFDSLRITGTHEGNPVDKELKLEKLSYPWIQQPSTGFRPFVLSKDHTLHFYGIHPQTHEIEECIARKSTEQLDPYGEVIKVSFTLNRFPVNWVSLGDAYFDPETGDLLKMNYRLGLFAWGEFHIVND
ncbi:MAG TPA: hypothetical protein VHL30_00700 [Chlamydiales bacterium]|jgi:hypothetical protein|nr:hypothetical protein [Chlamydiales bacterium]